MNEAGRPDAERGAAFRSFAAPELLFCALAETIAADLSRALAARGRASLVVSGGNTPADLFDRLCHSALRWQDVTVTLADERWVPTNSDRSNEKLVRSRLLMDKAAAARFVPLKAETAHASDAEQEVEARIAAIDRPFDVTLLGMGEDGHTASLIPEAEGLNAALDTSSPALVRAIVPPATTCMEERLTLTLRALLQSRRLCVLIRGETKRAAYEWACHGEGVREAPIRAVLAQSAVPTEIFWSP
jgi:6-phosphogluconolactonase